MMSTQFLNEKVVRILIDAFNRRELEPILKLFAEEVVLHCPGKNRIGGEYRGKAYTWRRVNHYQLYRNLVIEAWLYESDQYLADAAF